MNNNINIEDIQETLLSCPCCGGKACIDAYESFNDDHSGFTILSITCKECHLSTQAYIINISSKNSIKRYYKTKYAGILKLCKLWNTRNKSIRVKTANDIKTCPFCGNGATITMEFNTHRKIKNKRISISKLHTGKYIIGTNSLLSDKTLDIVDSCVIRCNKCRSNMMAFDLYDKHTEIILNSLKDKWNLDRYKIK